MSGQLFARNLYTGKELLHNQLVQFENGKIIAIQAAAEASGITEVANLAPGFFDSHINGGEKYYFTREASEEAIDDVYQASLSTGTAYVLPTLITSPHDNILKGIDATRSYMDRHPGSGVLGMHLEGPYLNPVKRGAHVADYVRKPTTAELEEIIRYGKDVIRLMTIAPEMFEPAQIDMLLDSGITISAGHSNATYSEAMQAFSKGINLVTHLYNAMSAFGHRAPGLVGATFDSDVYAPIIVDGVHCDYGAASIAYKIKKDKLFLISDALFLNHQVQEFKWGEFDARIVEGKYINSDGNLAGATISLGDAVRNAVQKLGISVQEAVEMATSRPAKALNLHDRTGSIAAGYPAVFTTFDDALTSFEVIRP
ncbi:N-acetylglucosamine-6-phosphate deacetylase [Dyadobacter sandarakinus]|uniref:N-acetylglucosamine-6-phosphate deacetylase n=1 Tax=Dyadobacter sandarakinus TaxID=2747268 RepID=A0ABX7ID62_9BACT|nr:N-acetylglucosamine-6-phosphate deacetylase [Dyadobacter sandarakinus]QRR03743.1 N-acetylglucosamine-6-phosphate deacetylase [Dyadobacter sandarakinus]